MSKLKDELAEMQRQRDAALAWWVGTEKELKDSCTTNYMGVTGMTLRDYFAGQALCGFISASANRDVLAKLDAGMCYLMADSMITARNQEAAK